MAISLMVISSMTLGQVDLAEDRLLSPKALGQLRWFAMGSVVYLFFVGLDYSKLREATWPFYGLCLLALFGLFFTRSSHQVQRWYTLPIIHVGVQPSELTKLAVVFALSWYLERVRSRATSWRTAAIAGLIAGVPFLLILKQPDLGTAMVLWPITLAIFYFGGVRPGLLRGMVVASALGFALILSIFLGLLDHEEMRPTMTRFMKPYQYERLNPDTHHQRAALIAIGSGGITGSGWKKGTYSGKGWLPAAETDSVFPAFVEEFGLLGAFALLFLFYALLAFGFQVTAVAKDYFGRLLSAGITVYIGMHVLTNVGMMCGLLPITGVPLTLVTYGGSSTFVTMAALGILQSIYSRRFMF